jgi:hypothetical protein
MPQPMKLRQRALYAGAAQLSNRIAGEADTNLYIDR